MSKYRLSQVENWRKRRNTPGRGYCFGGSARFEWDMATDTGTYQGGDIGHHTSISLPCAEDNWQVVALHTYEVIQGDKRAIGTKGTGGVEAGRQEKAAQVERMHDNNR